MTSLSGRMIKATQHSMNRQHNPFLFPDTTSQERWEESANCKGKAFELFEYQEKDSPLTDGMKYKQRIEFNRVNFELASEICIECPVMFKCEEAATPTERYWTVRGGHPPGRFDEEARRYDNVGGRVIAAPTDRVCKRGHVVKGGGRCKDCKRANNTERQRRVRREARAEVQDGVT